MNNTKIDYMKEILITITVVWAITQLSTKDLKALKQGDKIQVKDKTVEVWAMPNKNILIVKEVSND